MWLERYVEKSHDLYDLVFSSDKDMRYLWSVLRIGMPM